MPGVARSTRAGQGRHGVGRSVPSRQWSQLIREEADAGDFEFVGGGGGVRDGHGHEFLGLPWVDGYVTKPAGHCGTGGLVDAIGVPVLSIFQSP